MEVLHSEIIDMSHSILTLYIFYCFVSIAVGLAIYIHNKKDWKSALLVSIFFIVISTLVYSIEDKDDYEYVKVKVTDWNIVHNEGWEIIKQDGEVVELKRKLEEK